MKQFWVLILVLFSMVTSAQEGNTILRFEEYLCYVKAYHPMVKQANLIIDEGQANLMKARGAFDPKIEVDYARKKFKSIEYFDKLNTTFKVPTWYGIELKGNFENNDGDFLNSEGRLPDDGLYSAGVSFSLAQGLLINKRMAALKQAKLYRKQAAEDRVIGVNKVLHEASLVYFNWLRRYNEAELYKAFLTNAEIRFIGVKQNVEVGELPAIDSVEARIAFNNRKLNLEKARIKLTKASLELSNYLWLENNIPVEVQDGVIPDIESVSVVENVLEIDSLLLTDSALEEHPKIRSLDYKYESLKVNKHLKANMLLPKVALQYNFLSEQPNVIRTFSTSAYKSGLNMSFPLFLRKERGDLRMAKIKLQDTEYEINVTKQIIKNKIDAIQQELESFEVQNGLTQNVVSDYESLLRAEDRKFTLGESSLFLVNSRERKLIEAKLKAIELENSFLSTKALLFKSLAIDPEM